MKPVIITRRQDMIALVILAALAIGFLWPCTLAGKVMLPADLFLIMEPWKHHSGQFPEFKQVSNPILDAVQQFYPWRQFAGENLRQGIIPLWNLHELCGNPFVANNQSAVFYPETWLHAIMPSERALAWATALYFFISGGLMYWFLRVLGLRWWACIMGSVSFMFNGFIIGWACFPSFRSVPGWLPGMLAGFELWRRGGNVKWLALGATCTGLQFLAGNLHISLYVLMIFGAWVLFSVFFAENASGRKLRLLHLGGAVMTVILGTSLAAVQLLPTLEFVRLSMRAAGGEYWEILTNAIPAQNLFTLLMPDLLGNPTSNNHWGAYLGQVYRAYTESAFYAGLLPVLCFAAAFYSRRREAIFWLVLVIVGALLAIGTPLNAVLYYLVPAFKSLSGIGRAVILISVGVSVGGAIGFDTLLKWAEERQEILTGYITRATIIILIIGLGIGFWAWMTTGSLEGDLPGIGDFTGMQILRFMILLVAGAIGLGLLARMPKPGICIALITLVVDMLIFVNQFTPATNPAYLQIKTNTVSTMQTANTVEGGFTRLVSVGKDAVHRMPPNTPMLHDLLDIQGSDSLEIGAYRFLLNDTFNDKLGFLQPDPTHPILNLLGVKYLHSGVALKFDAQDKNAPQWRLLSSDEGYLYENLTVLPRAFMPEKINLTDSKTARAAVLNQAFKPLTASYITLTTSQSGELRQQPVPVKISEQNVNSIELQGSWKEGQWVFLTDTYYPGWTAWQGTNRLEMLQGNFTFRAAKTCVKAEPVKFIFLPDSFNIGGYMWLGALGVIAGLVAFGWRRREGEGQ